MSVVFVSFSKNPESILGDASFRYRCENLANALTQLGIATKLTHIDLLAPSSKVSHVVFHRPVYSTRLNKILKQLSRLGVTAVADFDDLVFDPAFLEFSPAILNNIQPLNKIKKKLKGHHQALAMFQHISVSTPPLKKYAYQLFPDTNIAIIRNSLHFSWQRPPLPSKGRVITYFPGTQSHNRDFWQIEDIIDRFLTKNNNTALLVVGTLESKLLKHNRKQIKHIQKVPFDTYRQAARHSWVNLLPLEPTPFNQCKSAIKVIEAGSNLSPTICSPLPDAVRFESCGATIAIDDQQWIDSLEYFKAPENYQLAQRSIDSKFSAVASNKNMASTFCKYFNLTPPHRI